MSEQNITWECILEEERRKEYFIRLNNYIEKEYATKAVYPPKDEVFTAIKLTPFEKVKVVIIGQDPYHQKGQSHGLSFSVKDGCKIPPSLQNIYKEISDSMHTSPPKLGDLTVWAEQGVLLLNAVLTVRDSEPNSHKGIGWEIFTDRLITSLNQHETPIVFMLWGNDAKKKSELITNPAHLILSSVHPSPLSASRGFFGCNHFNLANEFLIKYGLTPIKWA